MKKIIEPRGRYFFFFHSSDFLLVYNPELSKFVIFNYILSINVHTSIIIIQLI